MSARLVEHPVGISWVEPAGMGRSAHALASGGRVWLIDPFEDGTALGRAAELGTVQAVIQLLDRHNRDCAAIASRLGVPHLRLPEALPDTPFEPFPMIRWPVWKEVALWWEDERALVVAEAVGTAPLFAVGRPLGVHPMLRLVPPRGPLRRHRPDRLLVGHGTPVLSDAAGAIEDALAHSRSDVPKLAVSVLKLARRR